MICSKNQLYKITITVIVEVVTKEHTERTTLRRDTKIWGIQPSVYSIEFTRKGWETISIQCCDDAPSPFFSHSLCPAWSTTERHSHPSAVLQEPAHL